MALVAQMDGTQVTVTKDAQVAGGGSILDLMMLGAGRGDTVELSVTGSQADERLAQITALFASGFGEE